VCLKRGKSFGTVGLNRFASINIGAWSELRSVEHYTSRDPERRAHPAGRQAFLMETSALYTRTAAAGRGSTAERHLFSGLAENLPAPVVMRIGHT